MDDPDLKIMEGSKMESEKTAVAKWMERRKKSASPDEEFFELLAEVLRAPELVRKEQ